MEYAKSYTHIPQVFPQAAGRIFLVEIWNFWSVSAFSEPFEPRNLKAGGSDILVIHFMNEYRNFRQKIQRSKKRQSEANRTRRRTWVR